jgi:hypothetical protein
MITKLEIEQLLGSFYTIDNVLGPIYLDTVEGFGIPESNSVIYDLPYEHGARFVFQKYGARRLTIAGYVTGATIAQFAENRQDLAQAFAFDKEQRTLRITNDYGDVLVAEVSPISALSFDVRAGQVNACRFSISLVCPDGIFYTESATVSSAGVTVLSGGSAIPTAIPMNLSSSPSSNVITITNSGSAPVYPDQIKLIGPGTNFTITNRTTGEDVQLNTALTSAQHAIIDLSRRTAVRNDNTNLYSYLTGTYWKLQPGANIITLAVGSGSTSATLLEITARSGYFGI